MGTPTYSPLANITLGSAASSITFSSIPASYRDLVIVFQGLGSTTLEGRIRFNSDSGSNYSHVRASGSGVSATSALLSSQTAGLISVIARATTTLPLQMNINIMDYSATDKHKTVINRASTGQNGVDVITNRWADTSAITSVQILTSTGNFSIGASATLYGVIS